MKIITKQTEVYTFAELTDEVKQAVIDKYYENLEYPFLGQDIEDRLPEIDIKGVFSNFELEYSLGYSQGDGLSFSADFDFEKFLTTYDNMQDFKKRALAQQYIVSIKGNKGRYSYAQKDCVDYEENMSKRYVLSNLLNLDTLFESVLEDIQTYYMQVCGDAEQYGYDILEYRMNFTEFEDFTEDMYLVDGRAYND